jgi:DNA polymerase Ligase (LigD)
MPRFAILDHDHPFRHWDFLLQAGGVLRGWRLLAEPARDTAIAAEVLPDHRPLYLDYEGPVSRDRGRVIRWDAGTFAWECDSPDEIVVTLLGSRVDGHVALRRLTSDAWEWRWR